MALDKFSIIVEPEVLQARISCYIADTIAALGPEERRRRIDWCRDNSCHGVTVERSPGGELVFWWADSVLGVLDMRALVKNMGTPAELS
jgi:hypothetical protein